MSVEFEDNRIKVVEALNDKFVNWLTEAAGEVQSKVRDNTRVDTGELKNSWTYKVDESNMTAVVGSPLENAIWEEYGTGIYAENGDGRKTPWEYTDRKGVEHFTYGKRGTKAFRNAYEPIKEKLKIRLENLLKELGT